MVAELDSCGCNPAATTTTTTTTARTTTISTTTISEPKLTNLECHSTNSDVAVQGLRCITKSETPRSWRWGLTVGDDTCFLNKKLGYKVG